MDGLISIQLGSMRRYARFLSLDEGEADILLLNSLEILQARGSRSLDATRLEMFMALHEAWVPVDRPGIVPSNKLDYLLARLTPYERASVLLCVFERFSTPEAARIAGRSERELEAGLARAGALTGFGWSRKILVLENDTTLFQSLEMELGDLGFEVIGPVPTTREAAAAAAGLKPDLLLSDADSAGDGAELDRVIRLRRDLNVPALFLCERPGEHAHLCSSGQTFLVRKPVSANTLRVCIRQAIASSTRKTRPHFTDLISVIRMEPDRVKIL